MRGSEEEIYSNAHLSRTAVVHTKGVLSYIPYRIWSYSGLLRVDVIRARTQGRIKLSHDFALYTHDSSTVAVRPYAPPHTVLGRHPTALVIRTLTSACFRRSSIRSGPDTASAYPGKFSTSDVSWSCACACARRPGRGEGRGCSRS